MLREDNKLNSLIRQYQAPENELIHLAKKSYESAMIIKDSLVDEFFHLEREDNIVLKPRSFMSTLEQVLFNYTGQNWLNDLKQCYIDYSKLMEFSLI